MNWMRSRSAKKNESEDNLYTRWEQDYDLGDQPALGLFDEYLEMGVYFTAYLKYQTMWVSFYWILNVLECLYNTWKQDELANCLFKVPDYLYTHWEQDDRWPTCTGGC